MYKHHKGRFSPKFPQKYKGDPTNIIFRSDWERRFMEYLDTKANVIEWSSEELHIWYKSPFDGRKHRYFPDFKVVLRMSDGTTKTKLIEVKPKAQTKEPKKKKVTRAYVTEVVTWGVNQAKWAAAEEYCADKGWEFQIITEDEIFGKPV